MGKGLWTKSRLLAFNRNTKVKYYIDGQFIDHVTTVGEYIDNGLTNYDSVDEGELEIEDNAIVIRQDSKA